MKKIKLTQGKFAIVDDSDFEVLNQHGWNASKTGRYFYATRDGGKVYMHRQIMDTPPGADTDHINGDGLDNRRSNLRVCSRSENLRNTGIGKNNNSGYKGVSWAKDKRKWLAQIMVNGKYIRLGYFLSPADASEAYIDAAKDLHGEFYKNTVP